MAKKAQKPTDEELLEQIKTTQWENQKYIFQWMGNERCSYNIGDYFSNYLLDKLYDKALLVNNTHRKQMVLIGTQVPEWITQSRIYCGTGFFAKFVNGYIINPSNICYLRGKLSRDLLVSKMGFSSLKDVPLGDNGLLAGLLYTPKKPIKRKYDVGIVVHWSEIDRKRQYLKEAKKVCPGKKIQIKSMGEIDLSCEDLFDFIMSCKVVVSSSLHGMVFAHSFGIPALYFSTQGAASKFMDYYSVYDRIKYDDLFNETPLEKALGHVDDGEFIASVTPTCDEVANVQREILNALPYKDCLSETGKYLVGYNSKYLLAKAKGDNILRSCSSGGVVPVLLDNAVKDGWHCFAVKFNESFTGLEYVEVDKSNMDRVLGAKYLNVEISDEITRKIRKYLDAGENVMVVGRPCQCHVLRVQFQNHPNLALVEIMCGGVTKSNDMWIDYINGLKKEYGEVYSVNFRAKTRGWNNYSILIEFYDGTVLCESHRTNPYMTECQKMENLNVKCQRCPFGKILRTGADITCGDAFGMEYIGKTDDAGTSIVCLNSEKGRNLMKSMLEQFEYSYVDKSQLTGMGMFNRGIRIS